MLPPLELRRESRGAYGSGLDGKATATEPLEAFCWTMQIVDGHEQRKNRGLLLQSQAGVNGRRIFSVSRFISVATAVLAGKIIKSVTNDLRFERHMNDILVAQNWRTEFGVVRTSIVQINGDDRQI